MNDSQWVWIVTNNKSSQIDVFDHINLVVRSIQLSYYARNEPKEVRFGARERVWEDSNGTVITATLKDVKTQPDHL